MSLEVGGLCPLDGGGVRCARRPVRTIGGCRRVDMADWGSMISNATARLGVLSEESVEDIPFCPSSRTGWDHEPDDGSKSPPMDPAVEWMELAFEPRLGFGVWVWPCLLVIVSG
jgi:hypothetical protein